MFGVACPLNWILANKLTIEVTMDIVELYGTNDDIIPKKQWINPNVIINERLFKTAQMNQPQMLSSI